MVKKLALYSVGFPPGGRIVIADGDGQYWTGTGWSPSVRVARRYHDEKDVEADYRQVEDSAYRHLPAREFVVPVSVRVRHGEPFTLDQLLGYLGEAVHVKLDHGRGTGPVGQSIVQITIPWGQLQEVPAVTSG